MRKIVASLFLTTLLVNAEIHPEQRIDDLRQLASLYAKNYAPYEWKRDAIGFDLYNLKLWREKALSAKTDFEYLDVLIDYVASLNDAHVTLSFPATFSATLAFTLDIYDGKVLVDSVTTSLLPPQLYDIRVGDELVSLDGTPAQDWIARLSKYSISANPRSTARSAAGRITSRSQSRIPWAHEIGDTARVVLRNAAGDEKTVIVPWRKSGIPITEIGPVPSLWDRKAKERISDSQAEDDALPVWSRPLLPLMNASVATSDQAVLNYGGRSPIFILPSNFQQRLGRFSSDAFFSGTFEAGGQRIGFIRIPSYSPSSTSFALLQFEQEIAFFQANTDGLIIDEMRNPGGLVSYVEELCRRLIPYQFRSIGFEVRATANFVSSFASSLTSAKAAGVEPHIIAGLESRYNQVLQAYRENRGRTGPVSLTNPSLDLLPARGSGGELLAYTKPIICLVDDFSASGGDAFPATLQDNMRALIVGTRTMGAGGSVVTYDGTNFTEGISRITVTLMNRARDVATAEYPTAPYVENIGVRPDVELDYMTRENLMTNGRPFVESLTSLAVDYIRRNR